MPELPQMARPLHRRDHQLGASRRFAALFKRPVIPNKNGVFEAEINFFHKNLPFLLYFDLTNRIFRCILISSRTGFQFRSFLFGIYFTILVAYNSKQSVKQTIKPTSKPIYPRRSHQRSKNHPRLSRKNPSLRVP